MRAADEAGPRPADGGAGPAPADGDGGAAVERLRAVCLALPEVDERVSHGEPTWFMRQPAAGRGCS